MSPDQTASAGVTVGCVAVAFALALPLPDAAWWCLWALNAGNVFGLLAVILRAESHGSDHAR